MVETDTSKHGQVRELILASVLDAVKQCQRHFGAGQGVATETDHRVTNLLNSFDSCLSHGVRRKAGKLKQAFGRREESGSFWPVVKEVLSEFQFQRLKSVVQAERSIDFSKENMGMVWLKVALNERNLQTILTTLLSDRPLVLRYYDEHAFIRDEEKASVIPTSAAGLGSVIFALNVFPDTRVGTPPRSDERRQSPTLQYSMVHTMNGKSSPLLTNSVVVADRQLTYKTDPLIQSEKISTYSTPSSSVSQPSNFLQGDFTPEPVINVPVQEIVRRDSKRRKAKIRFGDTSEIVQRHKHKIDEWSGSITADTDLTPTSQTIQDTFQGVNNVSHSNSDRYGNGLLETFPEESNPTPDLSDRSSDSEDQTGSIPKFVGELSSSPYKISHLSSIYTNHKLEGLLSTSPGNQLHASTQEALDATAVALGASTVGKRPNFQDTTRLAPSQSLSEMSRGDLEALMVTVSKQNEKIGDKNKQQQIELDREQRINGMLRDEIELEKSEMKRREEELSMKVSSISRENDLLKGQLKKYVGIVQSMEIKEAMGVSRGVSLNTPQGVKEYANQDNEKILQLSDMYGELMELNERLHKDLILKNRVILCMQDTMLSLGLQLPTFNCPRAVEQDSNEFMAEGILKREIVKIWIPSAFLREESFHVYQIYIRIHNDEWNVYRRYTEFHEFHHQLRKKVPTIDKFNFPPKKNIGRKDAKLVEERRQRLQSYLRYMVHLLSNSTSLSKPAIFTENLTKQKFLELLPFFSDFSDATGSRSSSPAVGLGAGGRRNSAQLPPPKSPTYKGL
ncbi:Sorting nexin-29 [Oopsacas minuta]|uniref:Sorting nexin-29 n=1 Tax=Oopsacas minuta TaxID=111878 RepID=A0AAV7JNM3_9METZ|nr:Sorting nexin-29 [Oopsacas minuta]